MTTSEPEDIDERIVDLFSRQEAFLERAMSRSASLLAAEIKRLARAEQLLEPYIRATFHLMDVARDLLQPDLCRAEAVELIALLESEEHARRIQSDFPRDEYESAVSRMSTCAYDNLAEGTAMSQGYNSEGMHGCITDGLQVCQRTGRLQCINCFREYAADVYLAADDLPLARHQARQIAAPGNTRSARGDRRWLGTRYEAWVLLLTGQLTEAEETAQKSLQLTDAPEMSLPMYAKLRSIPTLEMMLLLSGKELPAVAGQPVGIKVIGQPVEGEYPVFDLNVGMTKALAAACQGDYPAAIQTLTRWDRLLQEQNCLHEWFEVRLRLTAAQLLAGNRKQGEALAGQLQTKAKKARDWLTLRRLERLMDPETRPVPVPLLLPLDAGPFAGMTPPMTVSVPEVTAEAPAVEEAPVTKTPLQVELEPLQERLAGLSDEEEEVVRLLDEVLAYPASKVTHPIDAAVLLFLAGKLAGVPGRGSDLWAWAEPFATTFPQDAQVVSLLAWLAYCLGSTAEEINPRQGLEETLEPDRIDKLFRVSLELDPNDLANFARAGLFYFSRGDLGEAERCLARGFRLDRSNSFVAMRLADVYQRTDRPRDALMVLDTCLREGGDDPDLAWQAGMTAMNCEQFDSAVTYLNRYEEQSPGGEATTYYRAFGFLRLDKPEEAFAVLAEREPPGSEHLEVLRATVQAARGQVEAFRTFLQETLPALRLADWTGVPRAEIIRLFEQVWKAADCLRADPIREQLADFLLETGLAPNDLFEEVRERGEKQEDGIYYRCVVRQPLDEPWPTSRACLANEENWIGYFIAWGVLAKDEDEATEVVLQWQSRCYPLPAEVVDVQIDSENYTDKFGVVWQGLREGDEPQPEE